MAIYRSWEMASFLKHQETASAGFKLFFPAASSLLLTFREWRRVRTLLWSRLWLERLLWLVWSSVQTTQIFSVTTARLFGFLIIQVFTGVALLIFLKNFSFAFTTWLFDASTIKAYLSFGHAFLRKLNHVSLLV